MNLDVDRLARYPMESDDWIVTVLIGGIAMLFSFLVIPWFLVSGYLVRDLRAGMDDAAEPPVFDDWGGLLREGFVAAVIGFLYQLVPLIVFAVTVGGSLLALLEGTEAGAGAGAGLAGLVFGAFVSWLLAIVFGYIGMAGIINYARERRFGAGFDVDTITAIVTSRDYFVAWVYVIVLNVVVGFVVGVLNVVPILGGIVGVFVSFYALIIAGWLWGNGAAAATGTGSTTPAGDVGAAQ